MAERQAKKNKASHLQFSWFYEFMSELAKRLKSRIKKSSKNNVYKFRRPKELVFGLNPNVKGKR